MYTNIARKKIALLLCLLSLFKGRAQDTVDRDFFIQQERKGFEALSRPQKEAAENTYNVIYNHCHWTIDPADNFIAGVVTTWFKPQTGNFNRMEFDLSSRLTVDSVKYHNSKLPFTHFSNHIVRISLPSVLPQAQTDSITVYYRGVPSASGLGSFAQSTHSSVPVVWTLSEPYGARDWWPCKQNLSDKIDSIDVFVTCPQQYKAASNGLLLSETINGTDKTAHWKSRYPIATYLVAIAITNYAVFTQTLTVPSGTLPIVNYVYPEALASAQEQTKGIIGIMQLFDSLFIPYPFSKEKYGHAQFGWGGGMEHQTMSFMYGFDYSLMAHECAHQWFGDHVTCGSWQEIWLNEGFATYLEGLCLERYFPENWMDWRSNKIKGITSQPGGSVFCEDTTVNTRIFDGRLTYDKGAYLLRMLRWKTGDDAFFKGIRNYLNDPVTAGKFGKTAYLRQHLEATSGKSLTRFFNQWLYGQGYPSYEVTWKKSGNTVTVTIGQRTSHQSVPFFEMPVPVLFSGEGGDTLMVFDHTWSGQQFTCTIPFAVSFAYFDPEMQLLSKSNHVSVLYELPANTDPITVFPNPADKSILIRMLVDAERISGISIIDGLGKTVMKGSTALSVSSYEMDVSTLPDGVYYIMITTTRTRYRSKFVKL